MHLYACVRVDGHFRVFVSYCKLARTLAMRVIIGLSIVFRVKPSSHTILSISLGFGGRQAATVLLAKPADCRSTVLTWL
jgi:hypothetical protein